MDLFKYKIMRILKNNYVIYKIYRIFGSLLLNCLSNFIRTDPYLILFNSYGGKKYDDSPKVIYEYMKTDYRFEKYKFVWAFHEPKRHNHNIHNVVKVATFSFFITALKARCWITNSSLECGLSFKKKNTVCINTGHGTPLKKMGIDMLGNKKIFLSIDFTLAQSKHEVGYMSKALKLLQKQFLIYGLPRNDELVRCTEKKVDIIKSNLKLNNKKIILYAPTFREYSMDSKYNCVMAPPINFDSWNKELGDEYVVLFRAHYEIKKILKINFANNKFLMDVSDYPNLNELLIVSDILISDYSSIIVDYSILEKPIYLFLYDYKEYKKRRGLYFDLKNELLYADNEEKLLALLQKEDKNDVNDMVKKFKEKHVKVYGNSTKTLVDFIYKELAIPKKQLQNGG